MGVVVKPREAVIMHGHREGITTTKSVLWPGTAEVPVLPSANAAVEILSSSADDDGSPVGTGARTVTLYYLTSAGVASTSTLTLNGTTAVVGPTDFFRSQRMVVATVGSGGAPAGTITLQGLSGGSVHDVIPVGENTSHSAMRTSPASGYYVLESLQGSVTTETAKGVARLQLEATVNPETGALTSGIWHVIEEWWTEDGIINLEHPPTFKFPALADIRFTAIREAGSGNVSATVTAILGWVG